MKEIAYVDESNGVVRAFDKNHHILVERAGDLVGYTSSTVSIDDGYAIQVYRAEGGILRSLPSRRNGASRGRDDSNSGSAEKNTSDSQNNFSRTSDLSHDSAGRNPSGGNVSFEWTVQAFIAVGSIIGFFLLIAHIVILGDRGVSLFGGAEGLIIFYGVLGFIIAFWIACKTS